MPVVHVRWLGSIDYDSAWEIQRHLVHHRREGRIPDTLLLLEHVPPVITLGRATRREHLLVSPEQLHAMGIQLIETDRGGDITYHGPGQLVGYPVIDLREHGRDVHLYLRRLEEALIEALRHFGIQAHRQEGLTGVWVGDEKVAAMGIKVSHWITMHGFALNVCPDLSHFALIVPCGIHDKKVTSLRHLIGREVTLQETIPLVVDSFARVFNLQPVEAPVPASPSLL
ncbi:MAG: lipoyl(octanoyl) transferase LipB [Chthonomonadetes bacterium]|nr:lipoyl(octanoyl) transferase LipB [Chthonomonadetes bacterium]